MSKQREETSLSLVDFVKLKRKENCKICKMPVEVRGQIGKPASEKHISRDQQVEWLKLVTGVEVTVEDLNAHVNGRHDA